MTEEAERLPEVEAKDAPRNEDDSASANFATAKATASSLSNQNPGESVTIKKRQIRLASLLPPWVVWCLGIFLISGVAFGGYLAYLIYEIKKPVPGLRRLFVHGNHVSGLAFSPDGKKLYSASWDRRIQVTDLNTGKVHCFDELPRVVQHLALSSDGSQVAALCDDGLIYRWDTRSGNELPLRPYQHRGFYLTYSPDGRYLASGTAGEKVVRIWWQETGKQAFLLQPFYGNLSSVAFSPDSKFLAVADETAVYLWRVGSSQRQTLPFPHVTNLAFSPGGRVLALSGGYIGTTLYERTPLHSQKKTYPQGQKTLSLSRLHQLVFLPEHRGIIAARKSELHFWDIRGTRHRILFSRPELPSWLMRVVPPLRRVQGMTIGSLALSPDGKTIAFSSNSTIYLEDISHL